MDLEEKFMKQEINMKASLKIINLMGRELTNGKMEQNMKGTGYLE